jgi:NADPH2:quinone reductase
MMKAVVLCPPAKGTTNPPLSTCIRLDTSVPRPSPQPGQALLRVSSSSANPVDVYVARGDFGGGEKARGSIVGGDVAGVVVEAPSSSSSSSASSFKPGDRVWALTPYYVPTEGRRDGCWAEFVVADAAWLAPAPPENAMPLRDAGAGPLVLLTAWQALEAALGPPRPEDEEGDNDKAAAPRPRILITAASGGVGHVCVQLAKRAWGADVVAVAGARNKEFVLGELGADEHVDYEDEHSVRRALGEDEGEKGRGLDAAVDLLGGEWTGRLAAALSRSKGRGRLAHVMNRGTDRAELEALGKDKVGVILVKPDGVALARCARMIGRGQLKVAVAARFGLEQAAEALESVAGWHTRGKVVVTVDGE